MIRVNITDITSIEVDESYEGESIETKLDRITQNNEPITDGSPMVYTERKDGVIPDYDVRADKWDAAIEAMDVANKSEISKRLDRINKREGLKAKEEDKPKEGEAEPAV